MTRVGDPWSRRCRNHPCPVDHCHNCSSLVNLYLWIPPDTSPHHSLLSRRKVHISLWRSGRRWIQDVAPGHHDTNNHRQCCTEGLFCCSSAQAWQISSKFRCFWRQKSNCWQAWWEILFLGVVNDCPSLLDSIYNHNLAIKSLPPIGRLLSDANCCTKYCPPLLHNLQQSKD